MSFAFSSHLQKAVYDALLAETKITNLVGKAIYEMVPQSASPELYIAFGQEDVVNLSDVTGAVVQHDFTLSVYAHAAELKTAKTVAAEISLALPASDLNLAKGHLHKLRFLSGKTRRYDNGQRRRIDLRFRAFLRA